MRYGLTQAEAATAMEALAKKMDGAVVSTETDSNGALYVVAEHEDQHEEFTSLTICQEAGVVAVLDTGGEPLVEADGLAEALARA